MTTGDWRWQSAVGLGVLLGIFVAHCARGAAADVPCAPPGFVLTSGRVTAAGDHELYGTPASAEIGGLTLVAPNPDVPAWLHVREAWRAGHRDGVGYELVLRPIAKRPSLERVVR